MTPGSRDEPYDGHIFRTFGPSEFQCPKEERFRPQDWGELCPLSGVLLATFTQKSAKARTIYVTKGKEETGNLSGCWFLGCSLLHVHCQSYFSPPLILGCLIMKLSQFYTPLLLETSSFVISLTAQPEHRQIILCPFTYFLCRSRCWSRCQSQIPLEIEAPCTLWSSAR